MRVRFTKKSQFWFGLLLLSGLYVAIIMLKAKNVLTGDDDGYLEIAKALNRGKLEVVYWWGPGYPLILLAFIKYKIPLIWAKLLNAVFLVGTIVYLRSSLLLYATEQYSTRIALIMGIYLPFLFFLHMIFSEKYAIFLMSAIVYHYLALHEEKKKSISHFILTSILLSWLALTKVFYGYVIIISLLIALSLKLFFQLKLGKTILILVSSFLLCLPYLWHNYNLTGKMFYWSTSGGMSLYWISTPFKGETGTWFGEEELKEKMPVHPDHYKFYQSLSGLNPVERDDLYKREAIKNISKMPLKFLFNVSNNVLRMLFDFPYDLKQETWKTSWVVIPNMFLLTLFFASLYPGWIDRQAVPVQIWAILAFAVIAFTGGAFLSAYNRMFTLIVPIICVWTTYIWIRFVRFEIHLEKRPK